MAQIHEIHEVVRRAITAGGRVVADRLITPAPREGMLADGQQLNVRETHLAAIVDQLMRQLAIRQPPMRVVPGPTPASQMDFVNRHRRIQRLAMLPAGHPFGVVPGVAVEVDDLRGRARRNFGREAVRVGLLDHVIAAADFIFIERALGQAGDEQLPDAAGDVLAHRVAATIPGIEIADDAHARGVRRPDGEVHPFDAADVAQVCPQLVITLPVPPFVQQVQIIVGE